MYKAIPAIQETADELKRRQKHERDALKHKRLRALYLLASGQAHQRQPVAARLGVSRNTVARWLDSYAEGGLTALLTASPMPISIWTPPSSLCSATTTRAITRS